MQLSIFRSLRHRSFALLWGGQTISVLGDKIFQICLAWWVLQKTGSAVAMGTILVFSSVPNLIFLLAGGIAVDRFPRFRLLFLCDLTRGIVIGLAALLALNNLLQIWHAYIFSVLFGIADSFFQPAFRSVIPESIPAEDLVSGNSLRSLSQTLSAIIGPSLGAVIVSIGGPGLAFGIDSLSFLISAICLLPMLAWAAPLNKTDRQQNVISDLKEGIHTVVNSAWLMITIIVAGLTTFAYAGPMEVALPFLINQRWNANVTLFGLFSSVGSIGSILATIWLGSQKRLRHRGLLLYGAWIFVSILLISIGLPIGVPGILFAALLIGAANAVIGLVWVNTLQECVPNRLLGRVTSVDYLGSSLLVPVGYAVGGWATERFGSSMTFVIGGGLLATIVALGLLHPQIRALD